MLNHEIAAVFEEIADLLEFQGANAFRVRAYRNAARTISRSGGIGGRHRGRSRAVALRHRGHRQGSGRENRHAGANRLAADARRVAQRDSRKRAGDSPRARLGTEAGGPTLSRPEHRHARRTPRGLRVAQGSGAQGLRGQDGGGHPAGLDIASEAERRILWIDADEHVQEILAHMQGCQAVETDRRRRQLSTRQGNRRRSRFSRRHRATSMR